MRNIFQMNLIGEPYDFLPVAVTSQPRNESELQLYRVLQRANLLSYYDTFIAQGGDDVHQVFVYSL